VGVNGACRTVRQEELRAADGGADCGAQHTVIVRVTTATPELCKIYINSQSVPRSKHTPSLLYKPFSQCCIGK
jgi:hypothetical protein